MPPGGRRSPGHQARQRAARRVDGTEDRRFRSGGGLCCVASHANGHVHGYPRLHGARTVSQEHDGPPIGRVLAGRPALRAFDRAAAVPHPIAGPPCRGFYRCRAALGRRSRDPLVARCGGLEVPEGESGGSLSERSRARGGAGGSRPVAGAISAAARQGDLSSLWGLDARGPLVLPPLRERRGGSLRAWGARCDSVPLRRSGRPLQTSGFAWRKTQLRSS